MFNAGKWRKIEANGEFVTPRRQAALHVDSENNILLFGGTVHVDPGDYFYRSYNFPTRNTFSSSKVIKKLRNWDQRCLG